MAFEPYLSERMLGDRGGACVQNPFDPNCKVDERRQLTRNRWDLLRHDPCQRPIHIQPGDACRMLRDSAGFPMTLNEQDLCGSKGSGVPGHGSLCPPPAYARGETSYHSHFQYPKSHNSVDDCCRAPCPCDDKFPELPTNIYYCATEPETCPPLDPCTTYRHFYVPHDVQRRAGKTVEACWNPCECPMEQCTITRTDFTRKEPIVNGPSPTEVIKHGLWSMDQFSKEFTDETTTGAEFGRKCTERRMPYVKTPNLTVCECCPIREDTTTRVDYRPKSGEDPCYPPWISNDEYRKQDTNMERCTTYGHFFRPYDIPAPLQTLEVGTPGAIPFCTTNNLCYSCHDPEPNQKPRVEMRDNDPWPVVKVTPFRYTDNIQTDPCAPFRDDTIYKSDYYAKTICGRTRSLRPTVGYVPSLIPLNDDTTMKVSYPPYNTCQYKDAVGNAGNPNGVKWEAYKCPPETDQCLPRFNSPYGNPLKPFLKGYGCPCGPFDNRSSYNQEFIFRNRDMVEEEEERRCGQLNVPNGDSLYRSSFIASGGKKAAVMDPPASKSYRCMNPSTLRDTDTLYRLNYYDFWKSIQRNKLELYRGHTTKPNGKECGNTAEEDEEETKLVFVPAYPKESGDVTTTVTPESVMNTGDVNWFQPYRDIPYSGANILNRAKSTLVCHGHK